MLARTFGLLCVKHVTASETMLPERPYPPTAGEADNGKLLSCRYDSSSPGRACWFLGTLAEVKGAV